MKNTIAISILLLISIVKLNGQLFSQTPKNINTAVETLAKNLSEDTKERISKISPDSLLIWFKEAKSEFDIMDNWFIRSNRRSISKDTRLGKYYKKRGLKIPYDMIEVVLRTYQSKMNGSNISHDEILEQFQAIQRKNDEENEIRFTTDTLQGIYIPINLEDCFKSLDEIYIDSGRNQITKLTEEKYSTENHQFGIGIWIRNNWQLWGGSRLSKYFNQLGINHPDDMSRIITDSYHRYLRKEEINLEEQVKYYQEYWKKANKKNGG